MQNILGLCAKMLHTGTFMPIFTRIVYVSRGILEMHWWILFILGTVSNHHRLDACKVNIYIYIVLIKNRVLITFVYFCATSYMNRWMLFIFGITDMHHMSGLTWLHGKLSHFWSNLLLLEIPTDQSGGRYDLIKACLHGSVWFFKWPNPFINMYPISVSVGTPYTIKKLKKDVNKKCKKPCLN